MIARRQRAMLAAVLLSLMGIPQGGLQGQLHPGARIRVTTDSGSPRARIGTLTSLDADSLRFRGAKDTSLVGAGTGLLLGVLASSEEDGFYDVGGEEIFAASALLGAAGAGVGALIGSASHRDRWEAVPLPGGAGRARRTSGKAGLAIAF